MRSSDITESIARRWVEGWTSGDVDQMEAILAVTVTIEHNLPLPTSREVLVETSRVLAGAVDEAPVLSLTATDRRAALLYDCRIRDAREGIRLAEFLDLDGERIAGIRRVYDLTAVDRLLPRLRDLAGS